MRGVMVRAWCDLCAEVDQRTAIEPDVPPITVTVAVEGEQPASRTVDLCAEHHAELVGESILTRILAAGRVPDTASVGARTPHSQVRPVPPSRGTDTHTVTGIPKVPCPLCGAMVGQGIGLAGHVRRVHPDRYVAPVGSVGSGDYVPSGIRIG